MKRLTFSLVAAELCLVLACLPAGPSAPGTNSTSSPGTSTDDPPGALDVPTGESAPGPIDITGTWHVVCTLEVEAWDVQTDRVVGDQWSDTWRVLGTDPENLTLETETGTMTSASVIATSAAAGEALGSLFMFVGEAPFELEMPEGAAYMWKVSCRVESPTTMRGTVEIGLVISIGNPPPTPDVRWTFTATRQL